MFKLVFFFNYLKGFLTKIMPNYELNLKRPVTNYVTFEAFDNASHTAIEDSLLIHGVNFLIGPT